MKPRAAQQVVRHQRIMTKRRLIAVATLALLVGGCSFEQAETAADRGADRFRQLAAARQFSQIYVEADEQLRKDISESDLSMFLSAALDKLGPVKSTEKTRRDSGFDLFSGETYVILEFKTEFQNGFADERFRFRIKNGVAALAQYDRNNTRVLIKEIGAEPALPADAPQVARG